jgi:23S rRNA pseudouridine1911/1915/1917 synthase
VHPSRGHSTGTLLNAVLFHCKGLQAINGYVQPGIAHRLDKNTSGLILVAKNQKSLLSLRAQFEKHAISKRYLAITTSCADLGKEWTLIDAGMGAGPDKKVLIRDGHGSQAAQTRVRLMSKLQHGYLLECELLTGRRHQIRVHLGHLGNPIMGDVLYGGSMAWIQRQALHCHEMSFEHPSSGEMMNLKAPLLPDLLELIGDGV